MDSRKKELDHRTFGKRFTRVLGGVCLLILLVFASCVTAPDSLSAVRSRGVLLVGATGDYRPMSYLEPGTGEYVGFDTALVEDLAASIITQSRVSIICQPGMLSSRIYRFFSGSQDVIPPAPFVALIFLSSLIVPLTGKW